MGWGFLEDIGLGGINDAFSSIGGAVEDIGHFVSETWKDAGKILDQYVVKPIEKDPWGFLVTAAAASFGIPYIVGPGMLASGIASTAVSLAQGKDFDEALTDGVTAAVMDFGISEGMNILKGSPKPFGASANIGAQIDAAPTWDTMFGDTVPTKTASNQLDDSLKLTDDTTAAAQMDQFDVLDPNKEIDWQAQQYDNTSALTPDEVAAMNEGSYFDDVGSYADDGYNNNIETYALDDGSIGFDKGQYAAYTEPAPRSYSVVDSAYPNNMPTDFSVSGNEIGGLGSNVPDVGAVHGIDAASEYWRPQNTRPVTTDITAGDWWKHPIDTLGKYTEDKIGVDVTNPWIVAGAGLGVSYYQRKKAAEDAKRREEEARRNDPVNSPLFTQRLPQLRLNRNRRVYTGDANRYGQRNSGNGGEFQFYDPAVYEPIPAATGGQIRAPHSYYQYGNVPSSVKEYASGGLSSLSDGRSDDIPAVLSDGEYVMDAETVALLGNGSSDAGAKQLDRMRESLRKQKGKALSKGKFSPNAKSPLSYLQKRG